MASLKISAAYQKNANVMPDRSGVFFAGGSPAGQVERLRRDDPTERGGSAKEGDAVMRRAAGMLGMG